MVKKKSINGVEESVVIKRTRWALRIAIASILALLATTPMGFIVAYVPLPGMWGSLDVHRLAVFIYMRVCVYGIPILTIAMMAMRSFYRRSMGVIRDSKLTFIFAACLFVCLAVGVPWGVRSVDSNGHFLVFVERLPSPRNSADTLETTSCGAPARLW